MVGGHGRLVRGILGLHIQVRMSLALRIALRRIRLLRNRFLSRSERRMSYMGRCHILASSRGLQRAVMRDLDCCIEKLELCFASPGTHRYDLPHYAR